MKTLSPSCWTRLSSIWHFRNSVYCCGPLDSLEKVICKQFFFCGFNCPITFQDLLHKFLCANMATPIAQDRLFSKLYSAQCPHSASLKSSSCSDSFKGQHMCGNCQRRGGGDRKFNLWKGKYWQTGIWLHWSVCLPLLRPWLCLSWCPPGLLCHFRGSLQWTPHRLCLKGPRSSIHLKSFKFPMAQKNPVCVPSITFFLSVKYVHFM